MLSPRTNKKLPPKEINVEDRIEQCRKHQLQTLDLSDTSLTILPESIGQLSQLHTLDLSRTSLATLPESIGQLSQLRNLFLFNTSLTTLPESIGQLSQLRNLFLSRTSLATLPESIGQLSQLRNLFLSCTSLATLPESINQLSQLQNLDLSDTSLITLPESINQLSQLQNLDLSNTSLTTLPESIGQLSRLETLNLSNTSLTTLPESIGRLSRLETLNLSNTSLTTLPESIGRLSRLETLNLSNTSLTTLPESIGRLSQLRTLDLSHNQLVILPEWLSGLSRLLKLFLHGNNLLRLPREVLGATYLDTIQSQEISPAPPANILDYYFRVQKEMRPLNEAKLILVGRGFAGKTSLVNQLVHGKFQLEKKTEGIKITEWDFKLFDREAVRLNVWDFGGQEIMHSTHQFFLTQRSLYLVVINGREGGEDADADYWLKLIESFGDNSPVIVVLNKIKEHPFSLNKLGLMRKFPNVREIIKTDCMDGYGIQELRRAIERETDRLPHLRDAFPASWFSIKENLAKTKSNFLSFTKYQQRCSHLGEKDAYWQKQLATYLHRLGIALNFSDDPRLNDTHVLNPHWVTNGIYKIINSELLEINKGEIKLGDVSSILDVREYPVGMHRFLIDLMKKFDLCFSYTDDECHYLIPDLLEKQEPPQVKEFDVLECLNFQYHYPIAVEGLLPRFIVRSHGLIDDNLRWRTGAILRFENCRALVQADMQDKKVFISVQGPMANRQRLLAIIRSQFESIHYSFKGLDVREMVPIPLSPKDTVSYQELRVFEENGVVQFPKVIGGKPVILLVKDLLNGVDLEGTRKRENHMNQLTEPIRLFYSYSHKDEALRDELETHLTLMRRQGIIDMWHDRKIEVGDEWKKQIDDNLERADIVLLLISVDFIASDYCYAKEMKRALEWYEKGEALVIPIILRNCDWHDADFGKLQALPKDGQAVTLWTDRDTAWRNVSEGIKKKVAGLQKLKRTN